MKQTKAVFTGSFDPFTLGHLDIVSRASVLCDRLYIAVGINSQKVYQYSLEHRLQMIRAATEHLDNIEVTSYDGLLTEFMHTIKAKLIVRGIRNTLDFEQEKTLYCTYKNLYPELEAIYLMANNDLSHISSTVVKDLIRLKADLTGYLPKQVIDKK